jgi:hypothetical protein
MTEHQKKQKTISHLLDQYNEQYQPPKTEESNHKMDDIRGKNVYTSKSINSTNSTGSKKLYKWHLWYFIILFNKQHLFSINFLGGTEIIRI